MAFLEPVKPWRCTAGPVEPVNDIDKDVCSAKLQPTTVSAYPVDWDCFTYWTHSIAVCVLMKALTHLQLLTLPAHLPPYVPFILLQSLW